MVFLFEPYLSAYTFRSLADGISIRSPIQQTRNIRSAIRQPTSGINTRSTACCRLLAARPDGCNVHSSRRATRKVFLMARVPSHSTVNFDGTVQCSNWTVEPPIIAVRSPYRYNSSSIFCTIGTYQYSEHEDTTLQPWYDAPSTYLF